MSPGAARRKEGKTESRIVALRIFERFISARLLFESDQFIIMRFVDASSTVRDIQPSISVLYPQFISRSSPAICVTSVGRSDTFVREDKNAAKSVSQDDLDKVSGSAEVNDEFLFSLNEVRQSALSVVTKLDNLKKVTVEYEINNAKRNEVSLIYRYPVFILQLAFPHSSLVRRLSGSLSGLNRTPCRMLAPTKIRRSNTALAGTPTSSKSLTTEREDLTDRRRSISGAAVLSSRKLNEATRGRSVSSSNLSVFNNTTGSFARPAKNPKYAHVQSTIPKPIATKRKA